jgi:hypothetical protein
MMKIENGIEMVADERMRGWAETAVPSVRDLMEIQMAL